ncbi:MAG: HAMP domain-containing sensor histidine kinase [Bacteroidota bacterium]|nr:HAMP domain-containing sensor histidine kinase [Bacteroidota bacterium]
MSKKVLILLITLMSISLIGVIIIQGFFITEIYRDAERKFDKDSNLALSEGVEWLERREFRRYVVKFRDLISSGATIDTTAINSLYIIKEDADNNEVMMYRNASVEENLKFPQFWNFLKEDSINLRRVSNERETKILNIQNQKEYSGISSEQFLSKIGEISKSKEILFETAYHDLAKKNTIERRVGNVNSLNNFLKQRFKRVNIDVPFEFAIFNKDSLTSIKTENFIAEKNTIESALFSDENNQSDYLIKVNFPRRTPFLITPIISIALVSIIFTFIIIIVYIYTVMILLRQRQISQIKTDFINNMTHEFKTPIATINLALDSIKNPKTIKDQGLIKKYLKMIKDENERMHDQVENVLRMSQLEKKELEIDKTTLSVNELIKIAVSHVQLLLDNKKGSVSLHLNADMQEIIGNETHLINVMVNIIDNAIKYCDKAPEIVISTENIKDKIVLKFQDNGVGMSKNVQNKIFDKFYREQTGDLHNIKGHGLGLAYVKKIIDYHNGNITLESAIDKGSIFSIELSTKK